MGGGVYAFVGWACRWPVGRERWWLRRVPRVSFLMTTVLSPLHFNRNRPYEEEERMDSAGEQSVKGLAMQKC